MKITVIKDFTEELIPTSIWSIYTKEYKLLPENVIRVTELIGSPLKRKLLRENYENISRRTTNFHYQIMGTMIHLLLELKEFQEILSEMKKAEMLNDERMLLLQAKRLLHLKEKKQMELEVDNWKIVGEFDLFEDEIIYDYKVTSEFVITHEKFDKYEKQLQVYRYMLEKKEGVKIKAIKNVFLLRDFSPLRSKLDSPLVIVEYPIWEDSKVEEFIAQRLKLHESQPYCSDEDMMLRINYIVGNKRFSDEERAKEYAKRVGKEIVKEVIPIGCLYFCEVADFCPQWHIMKEKKIKEFINLMKKGGDKNESR